MVKIILDTDKLEIVIREFKSDKEMIDFFEVIESVRSKIMAKLEDVESGDKVDQAKKEILGYMEFLVGMLTGKKKKENDDELEKLNIILQCLDSPKPFPFEGIFNKVYQKGIDMAKFESGLAGLKRKGKIFEPRIGLIQKI